MCDWLIDNNCGSKRKLKSLKEPDIRSGDTKIKQHRVVTYLGCILDNKLSGKSMAHALVKINGQPKLIYSIRRLLFNALTHPHFFCLVWYPCLNRKNTIYTEQMCMISLDSKKQSSYWRK